MPDCNIIFFYDNTQSFNCFAVYKSDAGITIYPDAPSWFQMVTDYQKLYARFRTNLSNSGEFKFIFHKILPMTYYK